MSVQEQGRGAAAGLEAETSRVRLRLLEAFWKSAGLGSRERQARLEAALRESVSSLEPTARNRVAAQVMEELAAWAPVSEQAAVGGGGEAIREALAACLAGEAARPGSLPPEDERLLECVALMVKHLARDSDNYNEFLRLVAKKGTILSFDFARALQAVVSSEAQGKSGKEIDRLRIILRSLSLGRDLVYQAALAAAAKALTKMVTDLNLTKALESGKRGLEELERVYEGIAALSAQQLTEKYFSGLFSKEIQSREKGA